MSNFFENKVFYNLLLISASWGDVLREGTDFEETTSSTLIAINSLADKCKEKFNDLSITLSTIEYEILAFQELGDLNNTTQYAHILDKINQLIKQSEPELHKISNDNLISPCYEESLKEKYIFILSSDEVFISNFSSNVAHYGYIPFLFKNIHELCKNSLLSPPHAIILDLDFLQNLGGLSYFNNIMNDSLNLHNTTLIAISTDCSFKLRLEVIRNTLKIDGFVTKPVNIIKTLDKLDAIINNSFINEPYRVLVVDDSPTMIRFITRSLDTAGIRHYVVSQPEHVLDAISEFNPDLVLMDMYMPDCDGYEVAKIIRQNDTLTSLPIVFLSSEQDLKKQLEVMTIGADDFLTKPIEPEHLVSSLNHRIKRHRILGSIMTQDSLTGLLNHTRIKQQLEESIKKASRSNLKMSFAMVDIDFFKKVNDSYGHPAGDSVIKSLSKFLQKRLRNTDIIGRYGGEEFAIIFWDTDADNALKVLDTIREEFAHIKHMAGDKTFFCTFSAGIADFSLFTESQIISEAADEALYKSKNKGRNCISIAEHI